MKGNVIDMENELIQAGLEYCLPNGCTLYYKDNGAGGRKYFSDEIGGGVDVWDTCLVDEGTLLYAMMYERKLVMEEYHKERNKNVKEK